MLAFSADSNEDADQVFTLTSYVDIEPPKFGCEPLAPKLSDDKHYLEPATERAGGIQIPQIVKPIKSMTCFIESTPKKPSATAQAFTIETTTGSTPG
mmetsp:Transcript_15896/g.18886  ORF Transcript_15896/g.18886 Transcript_15896/m.18886 type:complete len:97 (+) Transcript_15896:103-393(+)|eukprot:CAMPEP_0185619482 /NCGR_PEP_ID=MMETSP0436-20130131/50737_1 /TAXON_ID=626734 ORGANISM="Favella taraikaensis, Strain Fe Narragansett Bay" /NCGR_SAMPLE_ID=MMETSP0436 /ASSEMBLY_ACC=CAM_ASM_000390 /LENGTH=96 /DNA_ID=CAMNT_0028258983 /DNA_START=226 /DNA_END=516 /DNA_ORIENTATION=+